MRFARTVFCRRIVAAAVLLVSALPLLSQSESGVDRTAEIAAMLPEHPAAAGAPVSDREAWKKFAGGAGELLAEADKLLGEPIPETPDRLYLIYSQKGTRGEYEKPHKARLRRLSVFAQAEGATDAGKYLPALQAELAAILAEKTWTLPAFDRKLENLHGKICDVDLGASMRGATVATALSWFGDRLPEELRKAGHAELRRRIFAPYLERIRWKESPLCAWVMVTHNWNAACHAGVVVAALAALPDRTERAEILAGAETYLPRYLSGFTPDGFSGEGVVYWNFGFGNYAILAENVLRATAGQMDFYHPAIVAKVAAFPENFELSHGLFPGIADSPLNPTPFPWLRRLCHERLFAPEPDLSPPSPPLASLQLSEAAVVAFPLLPRQNGKSVPLTLDPLRGWFPDAGVLVTRPAPGSVRSLAAAFIGGNNSDNHNHNDIGQFAVALGGRMPLVDPGGEQYTSATFSSRRYDSAMLNSLGHSVPVVAGRLQREGKEANARVIEKQFTPERDTLTLDLASAYEVPSLQKLHRVYVLDRAGSGTVEVTDHFQFSRPESFEVAVITYGRVVREADDTLRITDGDVSIRVHFSAEGTPLDIGYDPVPTTKKTPPTRIWVRLKSPVAEGNLSCRIVAADHDGQ